MFSLCAKVYFLTIKIQKMAQKDFIQKYIDTFKKQKMSIHFSTREIFGTLQGEINGVYNYDVAKHPNGNLNDYAIWSFASGTEAAEVCKSLLELEQNKSIFGSQVIENAEIELNNYNALSEKPQGKGFVFLKLFQPEDNNK